MKVQFPGSFNFFFVRVCLVLDILYEVLKISVIQSDIQARQVSITEHRCGGTSSQPRFGIERYIGKLFISIGKSVVPLAKWL